MDTITSNTSNTSKLSRKLAAAALTALLLAAGYGFAAPVELTIVHFNDLDRMEESGGQGGIARLAAVINAERANHDNVLVTFAGDAISPSLMSGFDKGAHMIELLNRLDLTAMAIGNHEYDFGPEVAKERIAEAMFPMLGANNIDSDGDIIDGAQASILVEVGPYQVGIFGLTTLGTAVKSSPGTVTFRPVEEVAAEQSAALREAGANLVIALAHTDVAEDRALLRQGAMDLLLSGDDHQLRLDFSGDVLFAESGEQADWVTIIDLTLDEVESRGSMRFTWSPSFRIINTARVTPDAELAAAAQVYLDKLSDELDIEIGTTATELDSQRATVRGTEAAIANLIADAMRAATGADVALTNGGGIRANKVYEPGTMLTRRDILSELPFGNKTVVLELTGHDIVTALENGFSKIEDGAGRFPHVAGLSVSYDPTPPGRRTRARSDPRRRTARPRRDVHPGHQRLHGERRRRLRRARRQDAPGGRLRRHPDGHPGDRVHRRHGLRRPGRGGPPTGGRLASLGVVSTSHESHKQSGVVREFLDSCNLTRAELAQTGVLHELPHVLQREHLASGCEQQLAHLCRAHAEAAPGDAGDQLERRMIRRSIFAAQGGKTLNVDYLVPRRTFILGDDGFEHDLRVELAGDDEVGSMIESGDALRSSGLAKADTGASQSVFDGALDDVPDQLADRIPVGGKRPSQEPLVQQHGIGDAQFRDGTDADESMPGIRLVEPMQVAGRSIGHT